MPTKRRKLSSPAESHPQAPLETGRKPLDYPAPILEPSVQESPPTAPGIGVTETAFTEGVTEVNTITTMYVSAASGVTM